MPSTAGTRPPQHAWGPGGIADRLASAHAQAAATARTPMRAERASQVIPEAEKATAGPRAHSLSPGAASVASTDVNADDSEGIASIGGALLRLGEEERATFQALAQQVADEVNHGGPRTRYSILRNFMNMSNEQLECCIELYTAHQMKNNAQSPVDAAPVMHAVPDTSATVAENAPEDPPVAMPLAPPPPRIPVPAPPISPAPGTSAPAAGWPLNERATQQETQPTLISPSAWELGAKPLTAAPSGPAPEWLCMAQLRPPQDLAPGWTPLGRAPAGLAPGPPGLELPIDAGHVAKGGPLPDPHVLLAASDEALNDETHASPFEKAPVAALQHVLPPQPLEAAPPPPEPLHEGVFVDDVPPATTDSALMPPAPAVASVPSMPTTPAAPPPLAVVDGPRGTTTAGARRRAAAPPRPGAASPSQAGISLDAWLRKRLFQLRVTIALGPKELLSVLQKLDDEQLAPPFAEAKLWLGFDEQEPMPAALEQLMTEYRNVRSSGTAVESPAAIAPGNHGGGWGPKHS